MTSRRIAYFNPFSGISGDMALGAMLDAGLEIGKLRESLAKLRMPGWSIEPEKVKRKSIAATYANVTTDDASTHRHLGEIIGLIEESELPDDVKKNAAMVFNRLGEAEAAVHDIEIEKVHFHEVGAVDSIIDITGFCIGLHELGIDEIHCGPVALGGGRIECEHGILPVPGPATALLLKGVPTDGGPSENELTTPTGAALMSALAKSFGAMPPMTIKAQGLGAGSWDLDHPNVLQLLIGETAGIAGIHETLSVIETNIDDSSPEDIGWLQDKLAAEGCLECYITPVQMKKSRPGILLTALCDPDDCHRIVNLLLTHSTTRGVRFREQRRVRLDERIVEKKTRYGTVRFKESLLNGTVVKSKPEYDDLKRIADENGLPIGEVRASILTDME